MVSFFYESLLKSGSLLKAHRVRQKNDKITWKIFAHSGIAISFLLRLKCWITWWYSVSRWKCEYLPTRRKLPLCKWRKGNCQHDFEIHVLFSIEGKIFANGKDLFLLLFNYRLYWPNILIILFATITNSYGYSAFKENNRFYLHWSLFSCVYLVCWRNYRDILHLPKDMFKAIKASIF